MPLEYCIKMDLKNPNRSILADMTKYIDHCRHIDLKRRTDLHIVQFQQELKAIGNTSQ